MEQDSMYQRTALLLGDEAVAALAGKRVLVVGVGGVGAYAVEMLVRTGVGHLTLIDADNVGITNLNRQLPALLSTLGEPKVDVLARRCNDINPQSHIDARREFLTVEAVDAVLDEGYDFVIDAIDTVAPKVALIERCYRRRIKLISSMGAGGRIDPSKLRYADISETFHDGLARVVRQRLKQLGILRGVKVVFSEEAPRRASLMMTDEIANKASSYGTVAWIPAMFGCMLAAHAINVMTRK